MMVLTRKAASLDEAHAARRLLPGDAGEHAAIVHLAPRELVRVSGEDRMPIESLRDRDVLAVAAVGEPDAFHRQLEQAGARVQRATYRDHHRFTPEDAAALSRRAPAGGLVVCTLKDAVKLDALWPPSSPLWYVSQQIVVEEGAAHLNRLLDRVLDARNGATTTAG